MDQQTIKFLKNHHLCAIATIMPDGVPHAVTLDYAIMDSPITLFFCIDACSITAQNVSVDSNMAMVVGWDEEIPKTVELHGEASIIYDSSNLILAKTAYYAIRPHAQQYENDSHTLFLAFTPHWHRLLDPNVDPSVRNFFKRGFARMSSESTSSDLDIPQGIIESKE